MLFNLKIILKLIIFLFLIAIIFKFKEETIQHLALDYLIVFSCFYSQFQYHLNCIFYLICLKLMQRLFFNYFQQLDFYFYQHFNSIPLSIYLIFFAINLIFPFQHFFFFALSIFNKESHFFLKSQNCLEVLLLP